MKSKDKVLFWIVMLISLVLGYFTFDSDFNNYSEIITYLSIIIGFAITSISILFNSPMKKVLYDRKIKIYGTELHRLKNFYSHLITFEIISVMLIFIIPKFNLVISILDFEIKVCKSVIVLPILIGTTFCFIQVFSDLLKIFTYPTNHNDTEALKELKKITKLLKNNLTPKDENESKKESI